MVYSCYSGTCALWWLHLMPAPHGVCNALQSLAQPLESQHIKLARRLLRLLQYAKQQASACAPSQPGSAHLPAHCGRPFGISTDESISQILGHHKVAAVPSSSCQEGGCGTTLPGPQPQPQPPHAQSINTPQASSTALPANGTDQHPLLAMMGHNPGEGFMHRAQLVMQRTRDERLVSAWLRSSCCAPIVVEVLCGDTCQAHAQGEQASDGKGTSSTPDEEDNVVPGGYNTTYPKSHASAAVATAWAQSYEAEMNTLLNQFCSYVEGIAGGEYCIASRQVRMATKPDSRPKTVFCPGQDLHEVDWAGTPSLVQCLGDSPWTSWCAR